MKFVKFNILSVDWIIFMKYFTVKSNISHFPLTQTYEAFLSTTLSISGIKISYNIRHVFLTVVADTPAVIHLR